MCPRTGWCMQFRLTLWKNSLLKVRRCKTTFYEIFVPLCIFLLLAAVRSLVEIEHLDRNLHNSIQLKTSEDLQKFILDAACGRDFETFGYDRRPFQAIGLSGEAGTASFVTGLASSLRERFAVAAAQLDAAASPDPVTCEAGCTAPASVPYADYETCIRFNATQFVKTDGWFIRYQDFLPPNGVKKVNKYTNSRYYGENAQNPPFIIAASFTQADNATGQFNYFLRPNGSDVPFSPRKSERLDTSFSLSKWARYFTNHAMTFKWLIDQYVIESSAPAGDGSLYPSDTEFMPFPVPKSRRDRFVGYVRDFVGLFMVAAFMWPFTRMVRNMVEEKEHKLKESMRVMGMRNSIFWSAWAITYAVVFFVVCLVFTVIGKFTVFQHSNVVYLFLFLYVFSLTLVTSALLVSSFFSRGKTAGTLSAFIMVCAWLPYMNVSSDTVSQSAKTAASLLSPTCFSIGIVNVLTLEAAFLGVNADTINENIDNFTLATAMRMLVLDIFLYLVLAVYVDLVFPSEFGVRYPWYFCCQPRHWKQLCGCNDGNSNKKHKTNGQVSPVVDYHTREGADRVDVNVNVDMPPAADDDIRRILSYDIDYGDYYEAVPPAMEELRGVKIRKLRKTFGRGDDKMVAVADLSVDMYKGQIFVLLGHNGAGKTVTINMLTGMMPISGGDAELFGHSISSEMHLCRKFMGICPQHDVLFDSLTVREHLEFFGSLKGLSGEQLQEHVHRSIAEVQLEEKEHTESCNLSGGQKRRLSLAIALMGDPRVVFLDEPTSGVDPFSRRAIWDLLTKKKQDRVIVLTTHFMDEADQLGDRIGILHKGRIKCLGSSLFLKRLYGVGYNLTVSKSSKEGQSAGTMGVAQNDTDTQWVQQQQPPQDEGGQISGPEQSRAIRRLIRQHVKHADLLSDVSAEMVFRLPLGESGKFPELLGGLDEHKQRLGIAYYGLSVTTMEEVFIKVGTEADATLRRRVEENEAAMAAALLPSSPQSGSDAKFAGSFSKDEGLMNGVVVGDEKQVGHDAEKKAAKSRDMSTLNADVGHQHFTRHFAALWKKRFHIAKRDKKAFCCQVITPLLLVAIGLGIMSIPTDWNYHRQYLDSKHYNQPNYILHNQEVSDGLVDSFNSAYGVLQPTVSSNYSNFSTQVLEAREDNKQSRYGAYYRDPSADPDSFTVLTNATGLHSMPAFFTWATDALIRNRTNNSASYLQMAVYPMGLTWRQRNFLQNLNAMFTAIVVSLGFVFVPASFAVFVVREREQKSKHIQLISGVSIPSYWLSAFAWDMTVYLVTASGVAVIVMLYDNEHLVGDNFPTLLVCFLLFGLSVIPFTYVLSFLFKSNNTAQNALIMLYLATGVILTVVDFVLELIESTREANQQYIRHVFRIFPNFCLGDGILWLSLRSLADMDRWDMDVVGFDLVFMSAEAVVYFLATLAVEYWKTRAYQCRLCGSDPDIPADPHAEPLDVDVAEEQRQIQAGLREEDSILLKGLRKTYPPAKVAVVDLWFGVPAGQCFGFLGVNGAGKTTALKMLTADETPTAGEAYLAQLNAVTQTNQVRQHLGYCPQFDALHERLTARETLEFYGRLRGIPEERLNDMVEYLLDRLSLTDYQDRPAGTYSGGNKRKLSVGIALIGNPAIVFLDEPSTGMDPVSRRFMWNFISETMATRAVILTTHSMEECEALCSRIGILVQGQLKCLGTSAHLKHRFGKGFQIDISTGENDPERAKGFLLKQFPGIREVEAFGSHLRYSTRVDPKAALSVEDRQRLEALTLRDIFAVIETHREEVGVTDYSVGQTTLEQIFVEFARSAEEREKAARRKHELAVYRSMSRGHSNLVSPPSDGLVDEKAAAACQQAQRSMVSSDAKSDVMAIDSPQAAGQTIIDTTVSGMAGGYSDAVGEATSGVDNGVNSGGTASGDADLAVLTIHDTNPAGASSTGVMLDSQGNQSVDITVSDSDDTLLAHQLGSMRAQPSVAMPKRISVPGSVAVGSKMHAIELDVLDTDTH